MTLPIPGISNQYSDPLLQEPAVSATQRVIDKWFELGPASNGYIGPEIQSAFRHRDLERLARGQQTDSLESTLRAMVAAQRGSTITQKPKRSLTAVHSNFISDLRNLAASIPKLPSALIEEVRDLPHAAERIQENRAAGDSPIEAIAKAPGVRMIPGAYLVANADNPAELARHPLFSLLDALPALNTVSKLTPAAKLSRAQQLEGLANRPLKAALTRKVVDVAGEPTVTRNLLGTGIEKLAHDTRSGQRLSQIVGKESRKLSRTVNFAEVQVHQAADPNLPVPSMFQSQGMGTVESMRATTELHRKYPKLVQDPNYAADTFNKATLSDYANMSDEQLAIVNTAKEITANYGAERLIRGQLNAFDGELYPVKGFKKMIKRVQKGGSPDAPGRFYPLIEEAARRVQAGEDLAIFPRDVQAYINDVIQTKWGAFTDQATLTELAQTIEPTWTAMRDAGMDPLFVHRVPTSKAAHVAAPKITEIPSTPSQVKQRTFNFEPHHHDILLGLQHQGIELLQQIGAEELIKQIRNQAGKTRVVLEEQYAGDIDRLLSRMDPRIADRATALDTIIRNTWTPFNPEVHGFHWQSPTFQQLADESWYIPKYLADNLKLWRQPKMTSMARLWDPVMGVFRTSLLALSPRWHVNNTIGGGIATAVEAGPTSFRFLRTAYKMVRNPSTLPEELRLIMRSQANVFDEMRYKVGRTQGRLALDIANSRLARAGGKVVDASYHFNQFIDETYRVMSYLQGKSKATRKAARKGVALSDEAAERAGLELANKVMQNWADMTPWERSTLRYVFPFYGWVQHITRFALRYPVDHPLRTSIFASLTRAELEDLGSGLPEKFLEAFFIGSPDELGNVKAFVPGGLNPFRDAPDYFTVMGFLSSMNPVLTTALEQTGVIKDGRAEAYPTLRYDSHTGQMVVDTPSLGGTLIKNIVPQVELFTNLIGANKSIHDLARTDPEAARRRMAALGGIPMPVKTINLPTEIGRNEQVLHTAETSAFNQALRTGDDSYARQFPGLTAILSQLRQLQSEGKLDAFRPLPMSTLGQLNLGGGI